MGEHDLKCPHCGEINELDFCDGDGELVTYWGDETHEKWCSHCDWYFRVREMVSRYYEVMAAPERGEGKPSFRRCSAVHSASGLRCGHDEGHDGDHWCSGLAWPREGE